MIINFYNIKIIKTPNVRVGLAFKVYVMDFGRSKNNITKNNLVVR